MELMYEGKAKKVFSTNDPDVCIIEYKDTATAFNGEKKEDIAGKGVLNCGITCVIYKMLEENGVNTHMIEQIDEKTIKVRKVEIVPLEVIIRNVAAGSFSKRYSVEEGSELKSTVIEYCLKDDALGDPMINDTQILALGLATKDELDKIADMTFKINKLLIEFFKKAGIRLIDFKIEIGRCNGELLLADEISPDTCRFWNIETNEKLDKDLFRRNLGDIIAAYTEVFRRIK